MSHITRKYNQVITKYKAFTKWCIFAFIVGITVGLTATSFNYLLEAVTHFRIKHSWAILLLPVAGLIIVFIYKFLKVENDIGTNIVIEAVHKNQNITIKTAILIYISTVLTHLCGGSAGREGAALQLGAGMSSIFAKPFKLDEKDKRILTMCGMSAGFAALFGTPLTSVIFAMELFSVGIMYYAALLPCTIASLTAFEISRLLKIKPEHFNIVNPPQFSIDLLLKVFALGICCAILGILCCISLKKVGKFYKKHFKNSYIRILVGSGIVITITCVLGNTDYNGAGMNIIADAIHGNAQPEAFALKLILTAVTLGAGFKGGEIVPVFFIGSTFGVNFASLIGFSPSLGAAIGLCALFCAVTNCPVTSLFLSIELFSGISLPLSMIAISASYMLSGYYSLYSSQKIVYSKIRTEFIDIKTL